MIRMLMSVILVTWPHHRRKLRDKEYMRDNVRRRLAVLVVHAGAGVGDIVPLIVLLATRRWKQMLVVVDSLVVALCRFCVTERQCVASISSTCVWATLLKCALLVQSRWHAHSPSSVVFTESWNLAKLIRSCEKCACMQRNVNRYVVMYC